MKVQTLSYIYKLHGTHAFGSLYYVLKSFCDEIYPNNDIEWCELIYSWDSPQRCRLNHIKRNRYIVSSNVCLDRAKTHEMCVKN